jgi:hypothetical protein
LSEVETSKKKDTAHSPTRHSTGFDFAQPNWQGGKRPNDTTLKLR